MIDIVKFESVLELKKKGSGSEHKYWVVTDFVKDFRDLGAIDSELKFVIQPVEESKDEIAITGLDAYIVTLKDLNDSFNIVGTLNSFFDK